MSTLISLCGFMGAGKTTVGKAVASALNYEFLDTDAEIERQEGRSIAQIFEKDGESYFRAMEVLLGTPLFERSKLVLGLGGGALTNPELLALAQQKTFMVYLDVADAWTLYDRLHGKTDRPLLKGVDSYEGFEGLYRKLMSRRRPGYERARLTIQTDRLTADQVTERVLQVVAKKAVRGTP
jgi:shikimate kinase